MQLHNILVNMQILKIYLQIGIDLHHHIIFTFMTNIKLNMTRNSINMEHASFLILSILLLYNRSSAVTYQFCVVE